jgi:hypothetical protein
MNILGLCQQAELFIETEFPLAWWIHSIWPLPAIHSGVKSPCRTLTEKPVVAPPLKDPIWRADWPSVDPTDTWRVSLSQD